MTALLAPAAEPDPRPAEREEVRSHREHEAWWCGLAADAGPEEHRRCEDVMPELILELL